MSGGNQRLREYRAEYAVEGRAVRLPTLDHVKALVTLIERCDFIKPEQKGVIVTLSLQTSKAYYSSGTIHLPATASDNASGSWAYSDLTIAHEYAHHLAPGRNHDEVFTYFLLRILDGIGRTSLAQALRESYSKHGVAVYQCEESA